MAEHPEHPEPSWHQRHTGGRFRAVPAALALLCAGLAAAGCAPTTGSSPPASPATTASSTGRAESPATAIATPGTAHPQATTPTPTPAPARTLLDQQGSGTASTQTFSAPANWDLVWTYDCSSFGASGNFEVDVQGNIGPLGVNQLGTSGSGTEYYHQGGSYYLEVNSECAWHITARTAAGGENGGSSLDASGSGSHSTQTFTVPDTWNLSWSYDCSSLGTSGNFEVDVQNSLVQGVNQLGTKDTGTEHYHSGGTVWLEINSECSWHVTASAA